VLKALLITILSIGAVGAEKFNPDNSLVDRIIIKKSVRMLYLSSKGSIFKGYHISLGKSPVGAKVKEGDMKTPEGVYILDWSSSVRSITRSLHISYPIEEIGRRAKRFTRLNQWYDY